ncbi:MAG: OsmC family protein, partial [Actinomycetes bacterium]
MSTATHVVARNGVDTPALFATLDAVKGQNEIAKFQFRASNTWVNGTHNRSTLSGFYGAMQEMEHKHPTVLDADHPAVLVGADNAPTPVEYLLHAIAACLTAGIANVAAARGVELTKVTSTVEGDIDLLGILGLSDGSVRNGYEQIRVH